MPERRFKEGVDYWNIDIDIFENKKIRLIRGEFGIKGVYLYILILNEIYRTGGYYKKWDRDDCLLMSDSSGVAGDCSPELIAEVVRGLVRRSLFDKGVLDRFGVLTSAEIQRRFLRIVGNSRDVIPMVQEYFLLKPSNPKDVTRATFAKIAFFSIDSKDSTQNLKGGAQNLKVLDKEQNRIEQKSLSSSDARAREGDDDQREKEILKICGEAIGDIDAAERDMLLTACTGLDVEEIRKAVSIAKGYGARTAKYLAQAIQSQREKPGRRPKENAVPAGKILQGGLRRVPKIPEPTGKK